MIYVEIYKLQNDGSQEILAACSLDEVAENVVCKSSNNIFLENLKQEGIKDYSSPNGKRLFFSDGRKFLEQLKFNFSSAYLMASDIMTK